MSAISILNPKAEFARAAQAFAINLSAARGISEVMKSNLGPHGTMKMLVSGAGDIKITKDGNVLLHEMQIQHPTASLIAKASTAQDDVVGDGTTSIVLLIGEIMKISDIYVSEGIHPRHIADGLDIARKEALDVLDKMTRPINITKEALLPVALSSLQTKIHRVLASHLAEVCTDAVLMLHEKGVPLDLHMIEIMEMQHRNEMDTTLVKGLVMDHGGRHPDMPKRLTNCYILTCNVSLEYEKTEVNSGFFYSTAEQKEKLIASEREFIEERVNSIIALKNKVCPPGSDKSFVVINQKGIEPSSLDMLAKEGILALRRAKRRNMERIALACGGTAMNAFTEKSPDKKETVNVLTEECLGYAGVVYEHVLGENKFTFVEECKHPKSVTILLKGPTKHGITQMKDAIRDGLRSLLNTIEVGAIVPGAGAFEIEVSKRLKQISLSTRDAMGVKTFEKAILIIPKVLAGNAGLDSQELILKAICSNQVLGIDLDAGDLTTEISAVDTVLSKKQMVDASIVVATNLLLTDEIMRAGLSSLK